MAAATKAQANLIFRALADPTRREILGLLRREQHTVGELASNFKCSRPAISKHIRQLRLAGLVTTRRQGTASVCRLNARPLRVVDDWLQDYEQMWAAGLRGLKSYIEAQPEERPR